MHTKNAIHRLSIWKLCREYTCDNSLFHTIYFSKHNIREDFLAQFVKAPFRWGNIWPFVQSLQLRKCLLTLDYRRYLRKKHLEEKILQKKTDFTEKRLEEKTPWKKKRLERKNALKEKTSWRKNVLKKTHLIKHYVRSHLCVILSHNQGFLTWLGPRGL